MVAPTEASERLEQEQTQTTPSISRAAQELRALAAEFSQYAKYLLSLQIDRARLSAKRIAFFASLALIGITVLIGFLAVGAGLLLVGVSGLLGMLIGNFWAGATIVGLIMIVLPPIGALVAWKVINSRAMKSLRMKYADARQRQKATFNRDIKEVARG